MKENKKYYFDILNKYFDCIYIIIIKRNFEERFPKLKNNFEGLNYKIFEGTDGKELSLEVKNNMINKDISIQLLDKFFLLRYNNKIGRSVTDGEIGCSDSHNRIYKDMIENNFNKILILEDDAKINNIFKIPEIIKQIPNDCELLYWGYRWFDSESIIHRYVRLFAKPLYALFKNKKYRKDLISNNEKYPKYYSKNIYVAGLHAGTHAYSINKQAAIKLLKSNVPLIFINDQSFKSSIVE